MLDITMNSAVLILPAFEQNWVRMMCKTANPHLLIVLVASSIAAIQSLALLLRS
jgi:hypothetical protein